MRRFLSILIAIAVTLSSAHADPRIRSAVWRPDRVIPLTGHFGYQIAVEFPEGDRIENVAIGDSLAWQVTPNRAGTVLFLKPVDEGAKTNMTVMTSARHYTFELTAKHLTPETPTTEVTFVLRLKAPAEQASAPESEPEPAEIDLAGRPGVNRNYSYSGSPRMLPARVFDDGVSTMFEWPKGAEAPAIFVVRPDGKESIVNFSYAGDVIVVHQVAAEFILRNGAEVTRLHNEAFAPPAVGPDAPRPRERKKGFLGLFGGGG